MITKLVLAVKAVIVNSPKAVELLGSARVRKILSVAAMLVLAMVTVPEERVAYPMKSVTAPPSTAR